MAQSVPPFALIADDDTFIRWNAVAILESAGFGTLEASGVEEALVVLNANHARIVLLFTDVQMPPGILTGFDLAKECALKWPEIGIVVASGMVQPKKGELPDGAHFIQKPFSDAVVFDHLQKILPDGKQPPPLKQIRL